MPRLLHVRDEQYKKAPIKFYFMNFTHLRRTNVTFLTMVIILANIAVTFLAKSKSITDEVLNIHYVLTCIPCWVVILIQEVAC